MRIINDEIKIEHFNSKIFDEYFSNFKIGVFDIECMGLSPKYSEIILSCFMEVSNDGIGHITQYFLDSLEEEPLLVMNTIDELNKYDVILTYNGISFDIPFVKARAQKLDLKQLGFSNLLIKPYIFDLFPTIQRNSDLQNVLTDLKQKSIEKYLRLDSLRDDEISGKESIEFFKKYLLETNFDKRTKLGNTILLHNHDDVIQLYRLLKIISQTNFHRSRFKLGFPIKGINGWNNLYINRCEIKNKTLKIFGCHFEENFSYISFDLPIQFNKDGTFLIEIRLNSFKNALFIKLEDYGLENEDLRLLGGYVNGYIILKDNDILYKEANIISKCIINNIMNSIPRKNETV